MNQVKTPSRVLKIVKVVLRNLLWIVLLLTIMDWWQGRHLATGKLEESFWHSKRPILTGGAAALLEDQEKLTLIYAFAPWCQVCQMSVGNLKDIQEDGIPVKVLALNYSSRRAVEKFVMESQLDLPVILGTDNVISKLGVSSFPSYFLIHPEKGIVKGWVGYTSTFGLWVRWTLYNLVS